MVAAAGGVGGLRPGVAVAFLVVIMIGAFVSAYFQTTAFLHGKVELPLSPQELSGRARDLLGEWGYTDLPEYRVHGFRANLDYLDYINKHDAFALPDVGKNLKTVEGGERVALGDFEITFLHTPGHTEGSRCFQSRDRLMTGDTLFIRGCGRVDLPGSDPEKMYHSLRKLAGLGDGTLIFPGHNYSPEKSIPLSEERGQNPYIRASLEMSPEEFKGMVGL